MPNGHWSTKMSWTTTLYHSSGTRGLSEKKKERQKV